jgi:predicted transposase/invertase (TIGR01784 family)
MNRLSLLQRLCTYYTNSGFDILEGFLSELLKDDIQILEILEGESDQEERGNKFNRVDLKVRNRNNELLIIEVQHELDWTCRASRP